MDTTKNDIKFLKDGKMKKVARGLRAGILVANGFKDDEYLLLKNELRRAGFNISVISPEENVVKSERVFLAEFFPGFIKGILMKPDKHTSDVQSSDYDLLIVPGGAFSAYKLICNDECITFINNYLLEGKVLGALSDGSRIFKETGNVNGKHITTPKKYMNLMTDTNVKLEKGPIVSDDGLVTAQTSQEIQDFMSEMLHFLLIKQVYTDYLKSLKKNAKL
jgi:putative intracellular protease/amidase